MTIFRYIILKGIEKVQTILTVLPFKQSMMIVYLKDNLLYLYTCILFLLKLPHDNVSFMVECGLHPEPAQVLPLSLPSAVTFIQRQDESYPSLSIFLSIFSFVDVFYIFSNYLFVALHGLLHY